MKYKTKLPQLLKTLSIVLKFTKKTKEIIKPKKSRPERELGEEIRQCIFNNDIDGVQNLIDINEGTLVLGNESGEQIAKSGGLLHECVHWDRVEIAELLLLHSNIDVNEREGDDEWTALHSCVFYGRCQMATILVKHKDIDIFSSTSLSEYPVDVGYNCDKSIPYIHELLEQTYSQLEGTILDSWKGMPPDLVYLVFSFVKVVAN